MVKLFFPLTWYICVPVDVSYVTLSIVKWIWVDFITFYVALTLWVKSIQWKQEGLSLCFPWRFQRFCQILTNGGVPEEEFVFQSTILWAHPNGHSRQAKLNHSETYSAFSLNVHTKEVSKEYLESV